MSADKFFAGFIVGGVMGALTGILLAPASGEKTRKNISKQANEAVSKAESSIKDMQSHADDIIDELQKKGDELLTKVQAAIPSNN